MNQQTRNPQQGNQERGRNEGVQAGGGQREQQQRAGNRGNEAQRNASNERNERNEPSGRNAQERVQR